MMKEEMNRNQIPDHAIQYVYDDITVLNIEMRT